MNKFIIFALLGISSVFSAAITIPATCSTANIELSGVCQLKTSKLCKTYSTTTGACDACESAANADAAPACTCSGSNLFGIKASTLACAAAEDVANITCPDGWGLTNTSGNNGRCKPCTNLACKACNASVANTEALGTCTACYASGGTLASGDCPADATNDKLIPGHGWLAACPDGYVENTVSSKKHCQACMPGCKTCTVADIASKCATCKEGYLLDANNKCLTAVDAAGGTNACDASCGDKKCHTAKAKCTVCATGYEFTAADTCTKKPAIFGCKTYDTADATKCTECDTDFTLATDKKSCRCAATKYIKTTAYTAASGTTAAVYFSQACTACDPVCADGKQCKLDSNACEDKPAPTVACDDATLKDGGCNTCAKATEGDMKDKFVCSACSTDQTAATTGSKACSCKSTTHAWDKTNRKCVKCEAECTTAAPSCNLGTDGKATCGAAPASPTDDAGTNGILISAVSMILAVILA